MINKKRKSRKRQIIFICSAIKDSKLINKLVNASNPNDAIKKFENDFGLKPEDVIGPLYKKRPRYYNLPMKFTNKSLPAEYDGWIVNAFMLSEPIAHAYLVFQKRIDEKKVNPPKGNIIVPISYLRFITC